MAHPNILQRQAKVWKLLDEGELTHSEIKNLMSVEFECHKSAIHADIIQYMTKDVEETIYQSKHIREEIFKRDHGICQYCGDKNADNYVVEHVIPAFNKGVARSYNLVLACQKCNTKKRRQVWIPRNFDVITKDNLEWGERILALSVKDFRII